MRSKKDYERQSKNGSEKDSDKLFSWENFEKLK